MARTKQTARKETVAIMKYKQARLEMEQKRQSAEAKKRHLEEDELQSELQKDLEKTPPPSDLKRLKKSVELKILSDGSYCAFTIIEEDSSQAKEVPPLEISDEGESEPSDAESIGDSDDVVADGSRCSFCRCFHYPSCMFGGDACDYCVSGASGAHRLGEIEKMPPVYCGQCQKKLIEAEAVLDDAEFCLKCRPRCQQPEHADGACPHAADPARKSYVSCEDCGRGSHVECADQWLICDLCDKHYCETCTADEELADKFECVSCDHSHCPQCNCHSGDESSSD